MIGSLSCKYLQNLSFCHYYVLALWFTSKSTRTICLSNTCTRIPFIILSIKWNQTCCSRYLLGAQWAALRHKGTQMKSWKCNQQATTSCCRVDRITVLVVSLQRALHPWWMSTFCRSAFYLHQKFTVNRTSPSQMSHRHSVHNMGNGSSTAMNRFIPSLLFRHHHL